MESKLESTIHGIVENIATSANLSNTGIREFSQKLKVITESVDSWADLILNNQNLAKNFEAAVDFLLQKNNPHVLPDFYVEQMQMSFKFLSIWLLTSINSARRSPTLTTDMLPPIDSITLLCKQGFHEANSSLLSCVNSICPEHCNNTVIEAINGEDSLDNLYALYAFLEDFDTIEKFILEDIINEEDVQNCPYIPAYYHEEALLSLFQSIFNEVVIDEKKFLLSHANKMCNSLTNNPKFLCKLSKQILKSTVVYA